MEIKDKFIGPKKVGGLVEEKITTHLGSKIVTVMYENGEKEVMPLKAFEELVTEKQSDYTDLSKRKLHILVIELLKVIMEHDLKAGEIQSLSNALTNELLNGINRATHFLWTENDATFVPGYNVILDRSLTEADLIIKQIPQVDVPADKKAE